MTGLLFLAAMLTGQPSGPATLELAEAGEAIELAREEVSKYGFHVGEANVAQLKLRNEPIMRWTNHLSRRFYGDVFVWTHNGRPEAVATITNCYGRSHSIETEAHSLSLAGFTATRDGQPMWNPVRAGVKLTPFGNASEVADSPARRLQQMRSLARQFSAVLSPGPQEVQLRLLPQPVYRYASTNAEVIDGALFAFTKGTDPELFLMIEARPTGATSAWQYALARFNGHVAFRVSYDQQIAWTAQPLVGNVTKNPTSSYFTFHRRIHDPEKREVE